MDSSPLKNVAQDLAPLAVGFLEASARGATAELLRLTAARISDDEAAVVRQQHVLDLLLVRLIDILLVVRDKPLRDRLANCVQLRHVAATAHANANVHLRKPLLTQDQDR